MIDKFVDIYRERETEIERQREQRRKETQILASSKLRIHP